MKQTICAIACLGTSLALSSPAHAVAYCSGTISAVFTQSDGAVVIQGTWLGDYTQICNLTTSWKGIDAQVCWGWFAQVNTAITESRPVIVYYSNLAPADCDNLPTYGNSPAPNYFMLQ